MFRYILLYFCVIKILLYKLYFFEENEVLVNFLSIVVKFKFLFGRKFLLGFI